MQNRDDSAFPEKSASPEENTKLDTPKNTIAQRRKLVGASLEADHNRLKAVEYLGRRWLSKH